MDVIETSSWYIYLCSSCYKEIENRDGKFKCYRCSDRNVPHPYRKYESQYKNYYYCSDCNDPHPYRESTNTFLNNFRWTFHIQAKDQSGTIDILLFDREARTILPIEDFDSDEEVI